MGILVDLGTENTPKWSNIAKMVQNSAKWSNKYPIWSQMFQKGPTNEEFVEQPSWTIYDQFDPHFWPFFKTPRIFPTFLL